MEVHQEFEYAQVKYWGNGHEIAAILFSLLMSYWTFPISMAWPIAS
jgi:hypothetical protein